jgi:hypothetical protein
LAQKLQLFQAQVIDHLFILNAVRAKEERRLGPATKSAEKPKATRKKKGTRDPGPQGGLFE